DRNIEWLHLIRMHDYFASMLLGSNEPQIISDVQTDLGRSLIQPPPSLRSLLIVPFSDADRARGLLFLGHEVPNSFGRAEAALIQPLSDLLVVALRETKRNNLLHLISTIL